jgi:hypothetical protein
LLSENTLFFPKEGKKKRKEKKSKKKKEKEKADSGRIKWIRTVDPPACPPCRVRRAVA